VEEAEELQFRFLFCVFVLLCHRLSDHACSFFHSIIVIIHSTECYDLVMNFVTKLCHIFVFPMEGVTSSVLDVLQIRDPPGQVICGLDAKCLWIPQRLLPSWIQEKNRAVAIPAVLKKKKQAEEKDKNDTDTPSSSKEE
jgi:hypothetical protein